MIEVIGLTKQYGNKRGVTDISFKIEKGEVVGLLGPNGAGKSTIMKMITGYISPSSGTVLVDGLDIMENPKEANKKIGFLPEIPPLYTEMSVFDYLIFLSEIRGVKAKDRKPHINDVMELANIQDVKARLIRNLSKGYRQRVGLAQALIGFPEILILDEPTVGLDPKQITEVRNLIKKLSESHTIILSSHILSEINMICEKVIIINNGEMVAIDTVDNLSHDSLDTGSFLIGIKGEESIIKEKLLSVSGVVTVENDNTMIVLEKSYSYMKVTTSNVGNVREAIFNLMCKENMPIIELRTLGHSLEEVFLELTSDKMENFVESEVEE